jgi:transcriptional regulator with PAS, ATPase and Fis domain
LELAQQGTLLLNEIGEVPLNLQSKLLSVLEGKRIKRLGGELITPVDFRIIAATSVDLEKALGTSFREDLYYRLSVIRIHMPPLRERRKNIPELCDYLLKYSPGAGDHS